MRFQLMLSPLFQIALGQYDYGTKVGVQFSIWHWHFAMPIWEKPPSLEAAPAPVPLLLVEQSKMLTLVEAADELVNRRTKKSLEAYKVARDSFTFEDLNGSE